MQMFFFFKIQVLQWLLGHPHFTEFFLPAGSLSSNEEQQGYGNGSSINGASDDDTGRIPVELLYSAEAEIAFTNHLNNFQSLRQNAR